MPDSASLRVAFIGTGRMAVAHADTLRRVSIPHSVGGVYDAAPGKGAAFARAYGIRDYGSLRSLLDEFRPDIVHVVTPRGRHFEPALEALRAGASVYVEKPLVETAAEARSLLDVARLGGRSVCAGHQLIHDPAYRKLLDTIDQLVPITQVDSHFAFRPEPRLNAAAQANMLADILPHPLYSLIDAMERAGARADDIRITGLRADSTDLHALLSAGGITGRLSVTLRGRPVASTLTIGGEGGSAMADFIRGTVTGARNSGEAPLEKIFNPMLEGWQHLSRTAPAIARRIFSGTAYPGLAELFTAFYASVAAREPSPVSPEHLLRVTTIYQEMIEQVTASVPRTRAAVPHRPDADAPLAVLTGARGFLGRHIARHLANEGFRVRGISRTPDPENPHVGEWVRADLGQGVPDGAFAGATVVVHAAAETAGGYEEHQRNSIDATDRVLEAMGASGVSRLVYVSTLSVLEPRKMPGSRLTEASPLARSPRRLGPYAWGKTEAERRVAASAAQIGIAVRILRPAALIDPAVPDLPGLLGRRLFGRWHLGMGRPGLRIAVLTVDRCGEAVAWAAAHFDEAPAVVNLFDPAMATRASLLDQFRAGGWNGRMVWVPVSVIAGGFIAARRVLGLLKGGKSEPMDVWSVLRPQAYDATVSQKMLDRIDSGSRPSVRGQNGRTPETVRVEENAAIG